MILTEKHNININHPYYKELDKLCFLSKNLYNKANYIVRNKFIETSKQKQNGLVDHTTYLNYYDINRLMIDNNDIDYIQLPRKISNQTLMLLDKNWKSFFKSIKDYKINPNKYNGKPNLPNYKHKTKGRFMLVYELGSISKTELKNNGNIKLSKTNIIIPFIKLRKDKNITLKQCRIIPKINKNIIIEIVYEKSINNLKLNNENVLGIDIGINNLMALTSNKKNIIPEIINGRPLKSMNQYYNKKLSLYKSELPFKNKRQLSISNKINKLTNKRNNKIENYLHKASKYVIKFCIENDINNIIIGQNKEWKQESNMNKKNNQNFINIPFNKLINMIKYKGELNGIKVKIIDESYTSKASFLNLDYIPTYNKNNNIKYKFSGYRLKRGLYKLKGKKIFINADINGSYNILRKEFPKVFANGIEGVAVNPIKVKI